MLTLNYDNKSSKIEEKKQKLEDKIKKNSFNHKNMMEIMHNTKYSGQARNEIYDSLQFDPTGSITQERK